MLEREKSESDARYCFRLLEKNEQTVEYRFGWTMLENAKERGGPEQENLEGSTITFPDGSMFRVTDGQFEIWEPEDDADA